MRRAKPLHPVCGKVRYPSRKRAAQARMRTVDKGYADTKRLYVYGCVRCGGFHLSHKP